MEKPLINQRVFYSGYRNKSSNGTITKVGRKYFYVKVDNEYHHERIFYIEDWREKVEYGAGGILYKSEEAAKEEYKRQEYLSFFRKTFDIWGKKDKFTLKMLEDAAVILNLKLEEKEDRDEKTL